jgi:excisionase family DNA binding protein
MEQLVFDMQLLLDIKEASKVLNLSEDYLYRHWNELPFAFTIGKQIRFSMQGMMKHIEERQEEKTNAENSAS